jgi:Serine carboxypeptidase S28
MTTGIVYQLAKAFNGLGLVLEHRYYGESWPVQNLTTESLRFLTTDQSLADSSYFANNVVFPGLEHQNLTAKKTPWIAYGGSYAGAYVSFLRKLYPQTWFGAISSSGVTQASWDYHQYYDPIAQYGPQPCINLTKQITNAWDNIFMHNHTYAAQLKQLFAMGSLPYDDDFQYAMITGTVDWQGRNWDPAVNDPDFHNYCSNLSSTTLQYPALKNNVALAEKLLTAGGYGSQAKTLATHVLNWAGWQNESVVQPIVSSGQTLSEYFSQHNQTFFKQDDISQTWRSWPYQYCTQWGFLQAGSTVPKNELSLVSRLLTIDYNALICKYSFGITTPAKVQEINKYGGAKISYPRLAQIGGQTDPWRPATPLADQYLGTKSTTSEPRILIPGAVHHWDENGLLPNETTSNLPPPSIAHAQAAEAAFVKEWLKEWHGA